MVCRNRDVTGCGMTGAGSGAWRLWRHAPDLVALFLIGEGMLVSRNELLGVEGVSRCKVPGLLVEARVGVDFGSRRVVRTGCERINSSR